MNYTDIYKTDTTNGVGVRVVLWVSGCNCHCKNCHNPQTWDFNSGVVFDDTTKKELFKALDKPYIRGITFSGGHPLDPHNIQCVTQLVKEIKQKLPNKDIWVYTGYTWEQLFDMNMTEILPYIDVLVDGAYIDSQRDITLKWRGSANQRVIDVQQSLLKNKIILYCD